MKKAFTQLIKQWQLADDISLTDLLKHSEEALKFTPNDPELVYTIAELHRHTGNKEKANEYYQHAVELTDARTLIRAETLEARLQTKRQRLRRKLVALLFVSVIIGMLIASLSWVGLNMPDKQPADANPEKFAFTQWLAKQQMVEVMTTLQAQNPDLTFEYGGSLSSSPMESMKSMMQAGIVGGGKGTPKQSNGGGEEGKGTPAFQCVHEPAVHCDEKDIPNASGEKRPEIVQLMMAYRSILYNEKDCEKLESQIIKIGNQLQWRKSERSIKADLEDYAAKCFYKQGNIEKTIEHARKLQCISDDGSIHNVYWYLTAVQYDSGDINGARISYKCFQEATEYVKKNDVFTPSYIASRYRESGVLAWLYFGDLATATTELKKGRATLEKIANKTIDVKQTISDINLDLMETYVSSNIDADTFQELNKQINANGRLSDGHKLIKDTLVSLYYIQNHNSQAALLSINNIVSRFKLMPEYTCTWDWGGYRNIIKESIEDDDIRAQADMLIDATDCYVEKSIEKRTVQINTVSNWLRNNNAE